MRLGVSAVVSFVLIVAIMVIATIAAFLWASTSISSLNEPGRIKNLVNQMVSLDGTIKSVAHGDINFTTKFELYYPDAYFQLENTMSSLNSGLMPVIILRQNSLVLKYSSAVLSGGCGESYIYDALTHTTLYRYTTTDNVYVGAQMNEPGQAEIAICYTNINITSGRACLGGSSGPFATLNIKKEGVSGSVPIVSIDVC